MDAEVRWIRGPVSDSLWVFSGVPLGAVFATGVVPSPVIFHCFIALNTAHLFAPIAMAWGHSGFRPLMLRHWRKYVVVPLLLVALGLALGLTSWAWSGKMEINQLTLAVRVGDFYRSPLAPLTVVYFVWNVYHFAMQNYGVLRLYRPATDRALAMQVATFVTVMAMVVLPEKFGLPQLFLFVLGAVMFNHQLVALGLAAHVWATHHRRPQLLFVAPLLALGCLAAFASSYLASGLTLMLVIGARITVGFAHFLYDRWVWKLSDPQVRATIGKDLFRVRPGRTACSAGA